MTIENWLQLSLTDGIGPILTTRLIEAAGSVEAATRADRALLRAIEGIGAAKSEQIFRSLREAAEHVPKELDRAAELGVRLVSRDDPSYPVLLKEIQDPPNILYVKGTLEPRDLEALAIVGSRRCSHYGREQAERFGALVAGAGMTMISGGARGIDSAAHRGAMTHPEGRTFAVLGCGVDVVYPPENKALFDQIATRGAVISELPLGTPPNAENFPRRNRIVSGMSRGVLVIEADIKSGALITARLAGEDHGRPVMALPGRVDNAMSAGPHQLIRDGATLVTSLEDILGALSPLPDSALQQIPDLRLFPEEPEASPEPSPALGVEPAQQKILDAMNGESMSVDQIIERTELEASAVLRQLTLMSLKGLIKRIDGQTYCRRT